MSNRFTKIEGIDDQGRHNIFARRTENDPWILVESIKDQQQAETFMSELEENRNNRTEYIDLAIQNAER